MASTALANGTTDTCCIQVHTRQYRTIALQNINSEKAVIKFK